MRLILIRHGKTRGNLEGRYIGCRTDESLCPQGVDELRALRFPDAQSVFSSPMRRCRETAELVYPGKEIQVLPDLRECDFGDFEGLNYHELNGRADYQAWIDSGGEAAFPGGESRAAFAQRCVGAFEQCLRRLDAGASCAFVGHGGTVMALMERLTRPTGRYFDFQVPCGDGYIWEDGKAPARLREWREGFQND